jgi:hypothetical protein
MKGMRGEGEDGEEEDGEEAGWALVITPTDA